MYETITPFSTPLKPDNAMNFGLFAWLSQTEAARTGRRIKSSYELLMVMI
jgi:hypothetical protein